MHNAGLVPHLARPGRNALPSCLSAHVTESIHDTRPRWFGFSRHVNTTRRWFRPQSPSEQHCASRVVAKCAGVAWSLRRSRPEFSVVVSRLIRRWGRRRERDRFHDRLSAGRPSSDSSPPRGAARSWTGAPVEGFARATARGSGPWPLVPIHRGECFGLRGPTVQARPRRCVLPRLIEPNKHDRVVASRCRNGPFRAQRVGLRAADGTISTDLPWSESPLY